MSWFLIKNLRQKYTAGAVGVYNYNISCEKGEHLCIYAPEEGGKTSLLKSIAGLIPIEEGEIIINSLSIKDKKVKDRDVALIFQDCGIVRNKSVKWNLAYPLKIRKMPKEQISATIGKVALDFNLEHLLSFSAFRLKNQDKIRLAFARALARDAQLLLIDNPFALLKGEERRELFIELLPIIKNHAGNIVFATNNRDEAFTLGCRISILHYGVLEQSGTIAEIKKSPATVQVYSFAYGISANFATVKLQQEDSKLFVSLLGQKFYLQSDLLLNDIYVGSDVKMGFLAKESENGILAYIRFCEQKEGCIYAHLSCNSQDLIAPVSSFVKGSINIEIVPSSIRLYDEANEKLIY